MGGSGQLSMGTGLTQPLWAPLLSMGALATLLPVPVACGQMTWQGFCSKNLSLGIPDLRLSVNTPSSSAALLQLCLALLRGLSLGRPAC